MRQVLIIALWTICVHNAIAQEYFEGKATWRITLNNRGNTEYTTYTKNGNTSVDYSYMGQKIIYLNNITYIIDYSIDKNKPTVLVIGDTKNITSLMKGDKTITIGQQLELINGYNCVKIESFSETLLMERMSIKTIAIDWVDTSVNIPYENSPNGKGLLIKRIENKETNGHKTSTEVELLEIKKCKVKNKVFSLPDSAVATYTYIQDLLPQKDTTTNRMDSITVVSKIKSTDSTAGNEFQNIFLNKYNKEINDSLFADNIKQGVSVVDFSAVWCKPCRILSPIMENLAKKNYKRASFYIINADNSINTAKKYKIETLPTIIIFKDGFEIGRISGYPQNVEELILEEITKAENLD